MKVNVRTSEAFTPDRMKSPSIPVMVPLLVPFTMTVTPIIGSPEVSFTTPDTCLPCAKANRQHILSKTAEQIFFKQCFFFIKCF